MRQIRTFLLVGPLLMEFVLAQTRVDLRTQGKSIDFTAAISTKPLQSASTLPATCQIGQLFYKLNTIPGQNIYGCTATNIWSLQNSPGSGGGGVTELSSTTDLQSVLSGGTLTVGGSCNSLTPCIASVGNQVFTITDSAVPVLTGGTGNAYIYLDGSGNLIVGHNGLTFSSCSRCTIASGITDFPEVSFPLDVRSAVSGAWVVSGGAQKRSSLSRTPAPAGGSCITVTSGAQATVAVTAGCVSKVYTGAGTPGTIGGSRRGDVYVDTTAHAIYWCDNPSSDCASVASGNWIAFGSGGAVTLTNGVGFVRASPTEGYANGNDLFNNNVSAPLYVAFYNPFTFSPASLIIHVANFTNSGNYSAFRIYDSTCTAVANGAVRKAITATGQNTFTFAPPPSLTVGWYYLGFATQDTGLTLLQTSGGTALSSILLDTGITRQRMFTGAGATGSGTTLTLPPACGTRSFTTVYPVAAVLFP